MDAWTNRDLLEEITERKHAEKQLKRANEELETIFANSQVGVMLLKNGRFLSRAKSEFIANMSHELRTPLNSILGMTGLLSETTLSGDQEEFVQTLNSSGEMLLSTINDILDFSKIEAGHTELETIPLDITELIKNAGTILAPPAHEKGLGFACRIAPGLHPSRMGDPTRLRRVLVNLLSNAIKFTQQGEIVLDMVKDPESTDPDTLLFTVRDTGIGIPAEKHETIFEIFLQADMSTTREYGGTGLGLTITRRIVTLMGGRIWCDSKPGKGTAFIFTVRPPQADSPPASILAPAKTAYEPASGKQTEETPIIAFTAHAFLEQEKKCFDAGCTGFLSKPVRKRDLIEKLASLFPEKKNIFLPAASENERAVQKEPSIHNGWKAQVDIYLEDLIPELFEEIACALKKMATALEKDDFSTLERLGHGFKGAAGNYGMEELAEIFSAIEREAENHSPGRISKLIEIVADYIEHVDIKYT